LANHLQITTRFWYWVWKLHRKP